MIDSGNGQAQSAKVNPDKNSNERKPS
jgi:hypothetical protein